MNDSDSAFPLKEELDNQYWNDVQTENDTFMFDSEFDDMGYDIPSLWQSEK